MKSRLWAVCFIGLLAIGTGPVAGQTNAPVAQGSARPAAVSHAAPRNAGHAMAAVPQNFSRGPVAAAPRAINSHPSGMPAYPAGDPRLNYSPFTRSVNPTLAAINAQQSGETYHARPTTRMLARSEFARTRLAFANSLKDARDYNGPSTASMLARQQLPQRGLATAPSVSSAQSAATTPQMSADALTPREMLQSGTRLNWKGKDAALSFSDAARCHWHEWHDRDWWRQHCSTIVLVFTGYYFLDGSYWYPAWGYDPLNNYYDYDGPIYTYGNLLPDQVIANVQGALQEAGYYLGPVTGSLSVETRAALANFQRDYGLPITGAIDQPTIETLGIY